MSLGLAPLQRQLGRRRRIRQRRGAAPGQAQQTPPVRGARAHEHQGQQQKHRLREAGDQRHADQHRGGRAHRLPVCHQLSHHVAAEVEAMAADPGHHHGGGDRDQQRRDLRDQRVAHGEQGVGAQRVANRHAALAHADADAADQVHQDDDQPGDRVALDELHGAVHCAVQRAFALQVVPPPPRLGLVDVAGAQVAVDAHLLAGQRVEREARAHLGHALGALGDDDELHRGDDHEHHQPDHHIAGDHELAESLHDRAGIGLGEDQPRHRHFQRQPEHGGHEDDAGQSGEIER